ANVTYGGVVIGTWSGGTDGSTPLVVTFNASSTPAAAQALARNITYQNVSQSPETAPRTVRFILADGAGGTSSPASTTVNVTAVNDVPGDGGEPQRCPGRHGPEAPGGLHGDSLPDDHHQRPGQPGQRRAQDRDQHGDDLRRGRRPAAGGRRRQLPGQRGHVAV